MWPILGKSEANTHARRIREQTGERRPSNEHTVKWVAGHVHLAEAPNCEKRREKKDELDKELKKQKHKD